MLGTSSYLARQLVVCALVGGSAPTNEPSCRILLFYLAVPVLLVAELTQDDTGVCLDPTKTPNFPSHRNHIETLNIVNDSCIEY